MKTVTEHLRARLLAGVPDYEGWGTAPGLVALRASQWCPEFEAAMRARLVMGGLRYGLLGSACKPAFANVASAQRRLALYQATGNLEHLVDVANLCLCEYVEGRHPLRHFASHDDGEHVQVGSG